LFINTFYWQYYLLFIVVVGVQKMDAMGHLVDDLIARTHELLQPNPGQLSYCMNCWYQLAI